MRKTVPFVLTIFVSVLCTATLVHAAGSGSESAIEPTSVAPSRILGSGLAIETCKASPNNAAEWTAFAKCMNGNMAKIRKWGRTLDACFTTFQVTTRSDDVYGDPVAPALETGDGFAPAGIADPFQYFVGWRKGSTCPQT